MPGPTPKPPQSRQRTNRTSTAATLVEPAAIYVDLPAERDWHALTKAWWTTIWRSDVVKEWINADVPGLVALAILWDAFYRTGEVKAHAEARMATREFGLSPLSRRQLQWEVKRLEGAQPVAPPARKRSTRGVLSVLQGKAAG